MRARNWCFGIVIACALGSVCCSGADTAGRTTLVEPVIEQPLSPIQPADFGGVWQGKFSGSETDGVYLSLEQIGVRFEGAGALFLDGQPQSIDVSGAVRPDGHSLLSLNPVDDDADSEQVSLSLTFSGDAATGLFVDEEHPEGVPLTLIRPQVVQGRLDSRLRIWDNSFTALSKVEPNEVYRIEATSDGVAYDLTCTIQASALYEFIGSWRSNNGRKVINVWESGRLRAGVSAFGDFGRITLKDDSSVIQLADIWFRRHTQGVVGTFTPVDDGSYFYSRDNGSRSIGGKVFLVSR